MSTTVKENDLLPSCNDNNGYNTVQIYFRLFILPLVVIFGIICNIINILVFSNKLMRSSLINWFFMVLSISDAIILISTFLVYSTPVVSEYSENFALMSYSVYVLIWWYPIAQASHFFSVYITVLVSIFRYFGLVHPFLAS
uniref:G_PROTEIN_RECEP_F1_2 domain-containing protein n=1 Tax=Rhabditophanes sp. KR3021 TaxID=114890 RepID=A0AC35UGJ7_9BILA